jgi:prepilin-type processing-associated H-X9-DG protein
VFACPSNVAQIEWANLSGYSANLTAYDNDPVYKYYGLWSWLTRIGRNRSEVTSPSMTLYATDGGYSYCYVKTNGEWYGNDPADGLTGIHPNRHSGGLNIIFCDYHCKWMRSPIPGSLGRAVQ